MASEWNHILGASHATTLPGNLHKHFHDFVQIPLDLKLSTAEAEKLVVPIQEVETRAAIDHLKRHKNGGTTGLNHDFYKDFKDELAPGLTKLFNAILQGNAVPSAFLEATIVPLRKKGDSTDAMDYRPIYLLNTAYKIFGRILAERVHLILPKLISASQHGFVWGRPIEKAATIFKTTTTKMESELFR